MKLVQGQGSSLIRAQDVHTGELLDRSETSDERLLLGEISSTDGHRDREHGGHGDRNTADDDDENVRERDAAAVGDVSAGLVAEAELHGKLSDHEAGDDRDTKVADALEDRLEVARVLGRCDETRRLAEEGVLAGGVHDGVDVAGLDHAAREGLGARVLGDGERLAGETRLVDRERVTVEQLAVGRYDTTETQLDNVARYESIGR